jgi:hypothetical protein
VKFARVDGFVKRPLCPLIVIPVKAGTHSFQPLWIPAFAGMTRFLTFYDAIKVQTDQCFDDKFNRNGICRKPPGDYSPFRGKPWLKKM